MRRPMFSYYIIYLAIFSPNERKNSVTLMMCSCVGKHVYFAVHLRRDRRALDA